MTSLPHGQTAWRIAWLLDGSLQLEDWPTPETAAAREATIRAQLRTPITYLIHGWHPHEENAA